MSIFPLDAVRNATISYALEPALEELRTDVSRGSFAYDIQDVLEVYDEARPRLNVLLSHLQDLSGATGGDIGTGFGFLPVLLQHFNVTTIATEQDLSLSSFATEHAIEVREYRIGASPPPFPPNSLDFLIFSEVLEHLKLSPVSVLNELAQSLRPGGRFILTTPNVARLAHLEALLAGENFLEPFPQHLPHGSDPTDFLEHVREYSVREVVEAVEYAGFGVDDLLMTGWGEGGYHPLPNPYINDIIVLVATR